MASESIVKQFDESTHGKSPRESIDLIVFHCLRQRMALDSRLLCPLANMSSEMRHVDQQVKEVVSTGCTLLVNMFAAHLVRLGYQDCMGLADAIVFVLVGAVSLSQMADDDAMVQTVIGNAEKTIQQLLQTAVIQTNLCSAQSQEHLTEVSLNHFEAQLVRQSDIRNATDALDTLVASGDRMPRAEGRNCHAHTHDANRYRPAASQTLTYPAEHQALRLPG